MLELEKSSRTEIECGNKIFSLTFAPIVHSGYVNIYGYDITARKKAEKALSEQKKLLDNIISTIPNFVFWKDRNSVFLGCNKNFAEVAGFNDPKDIKGKTDYDFAWRKDEAEFYREIDKIVMDSASPMMNYEESQVVADGTETTILTSKVPLMDNEDNVIGILGIYTDITDLKKAQKALVESELMFRNIFEKSPIAIAIFDKDGKLNRLNRAGIDLFGMADSNDAAGYNLLNGSGIAFEYREEIKKGESVRYDSDFDFEKAKKMNLLRTEKTGKININVLITPLLSDETEILNGYLVQIQDITEKNESGKAACAISEDGSHRKTGRGSCSRFQQPAYRNKGKCRACPAGILIDRLHQRTYRRNHRYLGKSGDSYSTVNDIQ